MAVRRIERRILLAKVHYTDISDIALVAFPTLPTAFSLSFFQALICMYNLFQASFPPTDLLKNNFVFGCPYEILY